MATKKKEVLQKKSFAELINFRKKKEIKYEGEIIGTLFEPTNEEFTDLINLIIIYSSEQKEENISFEKIIIPVLLRKMWKSDVYTLDELDDTEVMSVFQSLGGEISEQLDSGLYELGIKKIHERINKLNKTSEELMIAENSKEGE